MVLFFVYNKLLFPFDALRSRVQLMKRVKCAFIKGQNPQLYRNGEFS